MVEDARVVSLSCPLVTGALASPSEWPLISLRASSTAIDLRH